MTKRSPLLLVEDLRRRILAGDLQAGERLPPLRKLAEQYGVSYVTVLRHIHKLCDEELLSRRHGSGVFVRERNPLRVAFVPGLIVGHAFESLLHLFQETAAPGSAAGVVIQEVAYAGTGPLSIDLGQFDVIFLSDYMVTQGFSLDRMAPLDGLVKFETGEREDYYSDVLRFFTSGGRLRMLPLVLSSMMLFYNRTLLERLRLHEALLAVRSMQELEEIHRRIRAAPDTPAGGVVFGVGYKQAAMMWRMLHPGQEMAFEPSLRDDRIRAVFRAIKTFRQRMGFADAPDNCIAERDHFTQGRAWGLMEVATLLRTFRRKASFTPDILAVPVPESELWCAGIAVSPGAVNKPGVRELLAFFKSRHALELIGREQDCIPARRSVMASICRGADDADRRHLQALDQAVRTGFLASPRTLALEHLCRMARDVWDLL